MPHWPLWQRVLIYLLLGIAAIPIALFLWLFGFEREHCCECAALYPFYCIWLTIKEIWGERKSKKPAALDKKPAALEEL